MRPTAVPGVWLAVLGALLLSACAQSPPGPPLFPGSGSVDLSFHVQPGCATAGPSPIQLRVQREELTISGAIPTGDSCPGLSARTVVSEGEIRLVMETQGARAPCGPCPGAVSFSAGLKGLGPGHYTVRVLVDGREIDRQGAYIQ